MSEKDPPPPYSADVVTSAPSAPPLSEKDPAPPYIDSLDIPHRNLEQELSEILQKGRRDLHFDERRDLHSFSPLKNLQATLQAEVKLFKDVIAFCEKGLLPQQYIAYRAKTIDSAKTLQNFEILTTEDFISLFAKAGLYASEFDALRTRLVAIATSKISKANLPFQERLTALPSPLSQKMKYFLRK